MNAVVGHTILCVCAAALLVGIELWAVFYLGKRQRVPGQTGRLGIALVVVGWTLTILGFLAVVALLFELDARFLTWVVPLVCAVVGFEVWGVLYFERRRRAAERAGRPRIAIAVVGWALAILGFMAGVVLLFGAEGILLWIVPLVFAAVELSLWRRPLASEPTRWPRTPLRMRGWRITAAVVGWITAILCYMAAAALIFGLVAGIALWIVGLIVLIEVTTRRKVTQQRALLGALAVSAERSISLIPTLEAFAREAGGRLARRANRLAAMLVGGTPLPEALAATRRLLPRAALPLIHLGYRSHALAPALRRAADTQQLPQPVWEAVMGRFMYLCWVLFMATALIGFMFMKVVPQYIKIFKDFGAELPVMTKMLVNVGQWLWPFDMIGGLLPLLIVGVGLYAMLRFTGWIQWDLPGLGWLLRRLDTALIFESLALAAEHRQPLPQALECLAWSYPKAAIRQRLARALGEISAGRNWCDSLLTHGLLRPADRAVLQAAERVGNVPWALREMADSNRRRLAYRLYTLVQLLFPVVILALGLAACCVAVGFFLPLLSLTYKLI